MFIYNQWDNFCKKLKDNGMNSVTAAEVQRVAQDKPFLILKHDVETNPSKAFKLAQIESKYHHKGSYYVQAYLLNNKRNINILKNIQKLGHEVTYHHDVMDSNKGNLEKADIEFQRNVKLFEKYGFPIETVCQHGNPVAKRVGYYSNRDFFRDKTIAQRYDSISDIMVNFKRKINVEYKYISDAGYGWKLIFDPENNDVIESSEKDKTLVNLEEVLNVIGSHNSLIISTHPHRWHGNTVSAYIKAKSFIIIRNIAKFMLKMPLLKKLMEKFYYLAKKI